MTKLSKETQEAVLRVMAGYGYRRTPVAVYNEGNFWRVEFDVGPYAAPCRGRLGETKEDNATLQRAADETAGRVLTQSNPHIDYALWPLTGRRAGKEESVRVFQRQVLGKWAPAEPSGKPHGTFTITVNGEPYAEWIKRNGWAESDFLWNVDGYTAGSIGWAGPSKEAIRGAMKAMSNVALVMRSAAWERELGDHDYEWRQRHDVIGGNLRTDRELASARWSAEVRAKVAALKPPGPVISCQGDWEDD